MVWVGGCNACGGGACTLPDSFSPCTHTHTLIPPLTSRPDDASLLLSIEQLPWLAPDPLIISSSSPTKSALLAPRSPVSDGVLDAEEDEEGSSVVARWPPSSQEKPMLGPPPRPGGGDVLRAGLGAMDARSARCCMSEEEEGGRRWWWRGLASVAARAHARERTSSRYRPLCKGWMDG